MHHTLRYLAIAVVVIGLGLPTTVAAQDTPTVSVQDNLFNPSLVQTSSAATITWTNADAVPHTITADDGSFDSGIISSGGTFTTTFAESGTYAYYCQIHGGPGGQGMAGTIVIAS